MQLSVVVPAYNEEAAIAAGKLHRMADWLARRPEESELLVVDDGSQDDTFSRAQAVADHVIRMQHCGKAAAIMTGIRAARGDTVLFTDMDLATPIAEAEKLLEALHDAERIAIGSRGYTRRGAPLRRYLLSWGQVGLRKLLLGMALRDTQCGFKAFPRQAALDIMEALYVYAPASQKPLAHAAVTSGFDVEFLYVAQRLGYPVREIPVAWDYEDTRGLHPVREAWHGLRDLLRIARAARRGHYTTAPTRTPRPTSVDTMV